MEVTVVSHHGTGVSTAIWDCAWDGFFSYRAHLPWIDLDYPPYSFQLCSSCIGDTSLLPVSYKSAVTCLFDLEAILTFPVQVKYFIRRARWNEEKETHQEAHSNGSSLSVSYPSSAHPHHFSHAHLLQNLHWSWEFSMDMRLRHHSDFNASFLHQLWIENAQHTLREEPQPTISVNSSSFSTKSRR